MKFKVGKFQVTIERTHSKGLDYIWRRHVVCPRCGWPHALADRDGVTFFYCPKCNFETERAHDEIWGG